jgi:hypothetical protein
MLSTVAGVATCCLALGHGTAAQKTAAPHGADFFDELYTRGRKVNDAMKTLTARFTETTTSLLTKPMIARGRVTVERPSRVVLRYAEPGSARAHRRQQDDDPWPSRNLNR